MNRPGRYATVALGRLNSGGRGGLLCARALLRGGALGCGALRCGSLLRGCGLLGRALLRRRALRPLLREQLDRTLLGQLLDRGTPRHGDVGFAVRDVRAETAVLNRDRLAGHRVRTELTSRRLGSAAPATG